MNNQKMANQGPITQSKNKKSTYMKTTKQIELTAAPACGRRRESGGKTAV
jgi:hypothetical protein